jgi:histidinol-phosphate aminotransferase
VSHLAPISLASNENPFPPLPGVLAAAQAALTSMERYPRFGAEPLVAELSRVTGHDRNGIVLGTGSVALLQHLIQVACRDDDEVVFAWRSFEAYPIVTRVAGAVPVAVPLTADHRHDLAAMVSAINDRTRVVILCSPNNPTGTALSHDDIAQVLDEIPPRIVVALDEAYIEYVDVPDRPSIDVLLRQHPNLVVLRTFSKAYGLAALRVGYGLASPELADVIRAVATPFGVNAVAQAAAVASLTPSAQHDLGRQVATVVGERHRLASSLAALGLDVVEGAGNFVWLPLGERSEAFAQDCAAQAISARTFPGEGVRITIGDSAATERLLGVAAAWRG